MLLSINSKFRQWFEIVNLRRTFKQDIEGIEDIEAIFIAIKRERYLISIPLYLRLLYSYYVLLRCPIMFSSIAILVRR